MYDSQNNSGQIERGPSSDVCRTPPRSFSIGFSPCNDFEKGMGVAVSVDGVLCTSKEAAIQLIQERVGDLYGQWVTQVEKM